jgi:hypothetical protein
MPRTWKWMMLTALVLMPINSWAESNEWTKIEMTEELKTAGYKVCTSVEALGQIMVKLRVQPINGVPTSVRFWQRNNRQDVELSCEMQVERQTSRYGEWRQRDVIYNLMAITNGTQLPKNGPVIFDMAFKPLR